MYDAERQNRNEYRRQDSWLGPDDYEQTAADRKHTHSRSSHPNDSSRSRRNEGRRDAYDPRLRRSGQDDSGRQTDSHHTRRRPRSRHDHHGDEATPYHEHHERARQRTNTRNHSLSRSPTPSDDDCEPPVEIRTDSHHRRRHRAQYSQRRDSSGSDIYESEIIAPATPGGGPIPKSPFDVHVGSSTQVAQVGPASLLNAAEQRVLSTGDDLGIAGPVIESRPITRTSTETNIRQLGTLETAHIIEHQRSSSEANLVHGVIAHDETNPPLPVRPENEIGELKAEVSKLQKILDEANCVQHSVTSTIESLQNNPKQLAAVAMTLAKVSTIARKMPPGAILAMRGAFPAAIALLCSPQFLIAAGATAGVTVVALGGYKIVKRIRRKKREAQELEPGADTGAQSVTDDGQHDPFNAQELKDLDNELRHITTWRQGIDLEGSVVEGEYATPAAAAQLVSDGVVRAEDVNRPSSKSASAKQAKADKKAADKAAKEAAREAKRGQKTLEQPQDSPDWETKHLNPALARFKSFVNGEEPGGFKALFKARETENAADEVEVPPPALPYRPLAESHRASVE